jgi:hypothetical protein
VLARDPQDSHSSPFALPASFKPASIAAPVGSQIPNPLNCSVFTSRYLSTKIREEKGSVSEFGIEMKHGFPHGENALAQIKHQNFGIWAIEINHGLSHAIAMH